MQWETEFQNLLGRASRVLRAEPFVAPGEQVFPPEYRSLNSPQRAVRDLFRLRESSKKGRDIVDLKAPPRGDGLHQLRIYSSKARSLDELMPILRNLNLRVIDQVQFKAALGAEDFSIRSFLVEAVTYAFNNLSSVKKPLLNALDAVLSGEAEDDALNSLILATGLNWKQVDLFRAYQNYYLQLGSQFGELRVQQSLLRNVQVTRLLHRYFRARFQPDGRWRDSSQREVEALTPIRQDLAAALEDVTDVNEDRILRDLFNLIDSTLRTNFYFRSNEGSRFVSFKISSIGVMSMPNPRPIAEIYVHSREMEGIHLRAAKVARGGIRWSDRLDDFRSEILDLMQTQTMKNALIVPQGAKGGFILKTVCSNPAECARLAQSAYSIFLRGLLELTDNVQDSQAVCPPQIVAYDDPDPYLVVAADKGTAGWSDRANEIAAQYHFWLGDAFATGGSHGYHHKKLGITARGAWVCVKRHFQEIGLDINQKPFTAVGVGSMDGDVFGNGALQSDKMLLLAAFNAEHIFLDPNPNPLTSYAERKRLFTLPRSTWDDYDKSLISRGGGVFNRSAKDIPLSPELCAWLGVRSGSLDGEGLIRSLLAAPVDLLFMGGVGTYVKASSETNETVGDRANDGARIDAIQLRAKVVGEGANLSFTQRARIEYALNGGRINTAAVDNSAGVDLSDHEVNLKILMRTAGEDDNERNRLLSEITDDVCRQVLANNYQQSLCLSLERRRCLQDPDPFMDVADQVEKAGLLDRQVESFPLRKEIMARAGQELTRPELAVLMAYAKLALKRALLNAPQFLNEPWPSAFLAAYFPERARSRYSGELRRHRVSREIAATVICNRVIDQSGVTFLAWTGELNPDLLAQAVALYLTFDQVLRGDSWRRAVCALDGQVASSDQYESLLHIETALAFLSRWALQHDRKLSPEAEVIDAWRGNLERYLGHLGPKAEFATVTSASGKEQIPVANCLRNFPQLMDLAQRSQQTIETATQLFEAMMEQLGLGRVIHLLGEVKVRDAWERRLQGMLDDHFRSAPAQLAEIQLRMASRQSAELFRKLGVFSRWGRLQRFRSELIEAAPATLAPFAALGGELDSFVNACGAAAHLW